MREAILGVDIGSVSTKGAVLDRDGKKLAADYRWTQGDPIAAVKEVCAALNKQMSGDIAIRSVGVTGSARRLIGVMLEADAVKNEITAHAVGTLSRHPDARTILEIGGQDAKIILIDNGVVTDYAMNSLCAAGTGAFLAAQAKRLGVEIDRLGELALSAEHPARIAARCTVFAESDMVHKAQAGYSKADLVAGLCRAVASNYLNNVGKGKRVRVPIVFQGGVSKNVGVLRAFEEELGESIRVDPDSHLMGAVGAAILGARNRKRRSPFDFHAADCAFQTKTHICAGCANQCEIISFYRDGVPLDHWGGRCEENTPHMRRKQA